MNVEEYITHNQESIRQECQAIENGNSNAIITIKEDGASYIYQVSTVEEFVETIPDNKFFKKMRNGINNAVLNKIIPIVIFENQQAKIISFSDNF
ncbi:MAG: hypothetical protein AAF298_09250 [Cyanobacteria bacterium P01_A01_bin.40]